MRTAVVVTAHVVRVIVEMGMLAMVYREAGVFTALLLGGLVIRAEMQDL